MLNGRLATGVGKRGLVVWWGADKAWKGGGGDVGGVRCVWNADLEVTGAKWRWRVRLEEERGKKDGKGEQDEED